MVENIFGRVETIRGGWAPASTARCWSSR